jgi:hypothetical protein
MGLSKDQEGDFGAERFRCKPQKKEVAEDALRAWKDAAGDSLRNSPFVARKLCFRLHQVQFTMTHGQFHKDGWQGGYEAR